MRKLYLHIGHKKTGSSFLQACFANGVNALAAEGITYPTGRKKELTRAKNWKISAGNGLMILSDPPDEIDVSTDRVLFSSEGLFVALASKQGSDARIEAFCRHHRIGEIEVLLFIRDPITHAESMYQQDVKRGGEDRGVERSFRAYNQPQQVRAVLERRIGSIPIKWHVFNYDRHRENLISLAERFLELPEQTLATSGNRPVNRSMTVSEVEFLRALNAVDKASSRQLADRLCDELPEIQSEPVFPSHGVQKAMLDRQAAAIEAVNAQIPEAEHYRTNLRDETPLDGPFTFDRVQIDKIAELLGAKLAEQTAQIAVLQSRRELQKARTALRKDRVDDAVKILERHLNGLKSLEDDNVRESLTEKAEAQLKVARNRAAG